MSQTPSPESIDPGDVPPVGSGAYWSSQISAQESESASIQWVRDAEHHVGAQQMTASLQRAIHRDPNPNGPWKGATLSTDGTALLIDTEDGRTFILNVREV